MKKILNTVCLAAVLAPALFFMGCAKDDSKTDNEKDKEYIEAWMSVHYPNVQPTGLGIYILDDQEGTGEDLGSDDNFVFINYTARSLDGTITSTTDSIVAQQVGDFAKVNYYGPIVALRDKNSTSTGILEMLDGMKVGGTRTALVPGWLNVIKDYSSESKYFKKGDGTTAIFTITLEDKTSDILKWEEDTLKSFVEKHMNNVDTTFYGYYSLTLKEPSDTATLPTDTAIYVNYTGKLLNGHVFDTSVEDTAKYYGIYSTSKTYGPIYVQLSSNISDITIQSSSSSTTTSTGTSTSSSSTVVTGFAYCLSKLKLHEKVMCAFMSMYGYSSSGSGKSIPSFAPLVFEVEMVDDPDE